MKVDDLINWLGELRRAGDSQSGRGTDRVLRLEELLKAGIMLRTQECTLLRLHEIEGHSLKKLQHLTGLPGREIHQKIQETRDRLSGLLFSEHIRNQAVPAEGNQHEM